MYLTKDDYKVDKLVKTFGCFPIALIPEVMHNGNEGNARALCHALTSKQMCFYSKQKDYLLCKPYYHPMFRVSDAIKLLLSIAKDKKKVSFFRPEQPGLAGIIADGNCYIVYSAYNDYLAADSIMKAKESAQENTYEGQENSVQYIFLTETKAVIKKIKDFEYPYIFAYKGKDGTYTYYRPEE